MIPSDTTYTIVHICDNLTILHTDHRTDHLFDMVVVRLDRLAALNHVPKPPTEREVLETSPAHEAAQPPATIARGDGGVVRPVVCPAAPAQSEGVVASRHVPAFGLSLICHGFVLRPDRATSVAYARASVGGTTAALSGATKSQYQASEPSAGVQ